MSQKPVTIWAKQSSLFDTSGSDQDPQIAVDSAGNSYVAYFTDGSGDSSTGNPTNIVVFKLNNTGTVQWRRQLTDFPGARNPSISYNGLQLVVAFGFTGTVLPAIVQIDPESGTVLSTVNVLTQAQSIFPSVVAVPGSATNACITFMTSGDASGGGGTNAGGFDIAVQIYNMTNGSLLFSSQNPNFNTSASDWYPRITMDTSGKIIVAYHTTGAVPGQTRTGTTDIVIFRIDPNAPIYISVWQSLTAFNSTGNNKYPSIVTDADNNIFVAYQTDGTAPGGTKTSLPGSTDIVIFKLSSGGSLLWLRQNNSFNTPISNSLPTLTIDRYKNVICSFTAFGIIANGTSKGASDIVLVKHDTNGKLLWASQTASLNTEGADESASIGVDASGYMYVAYDTFGTIQGGRKNGKNGTMDVVVVRALEANPPDPPGLVATPGDSRITAQITPPANLGGIPLIYYTLDISGGTTGSIYTNEWQLPAGTTSYPIPGLINGAVYNLLLTASNDAGPSPGTTASAIPGAVPLAPVLNRLDVSSQQITANYSASANTGGYPVLYYTASAELSGATVHTDASGTGLSIPIKGLTNGSTYSVWVTATNIIGTSPISNILKAIPAGVPGPPAFVTITPGNRSAVITYRNPLTDGGSPILYLELIVSNLISPVTIDISYNPTPQPPYPSVAVTGLTNGSTYTAFLTAFNAVGPSQFDISRPFTPAGPPDPPIIVSATGANKSATVTFRPPTETGGIPLTRFTVTTDPSTQTKTIPFTGSGSYTETFISLQNGTGYRFKVSASNAVGTSVDALSGIVYPRGPPEPPVIKVVNATDISMSMTWVVPFNGAVPITSFFWKLVNAASNQDTDISGTFTDPSMNSLGSELSLTTVISRLPTTVPYYFLIQAINEIGSGAFSNPSYSVPFPPIFTAVMYGNGILTYFWTAPTQSGGRPIFQNTIYLYDASSNVIVLSPTIPSGTQPITLTGLTNGTFYYAILRCWNEVGQGVRSAHSATAKPMRPPDAPTIVNISANDAALSVVWNAPANNGGDTVINYNLYLYDVSAGNTLVSTTLLPATPLFKIVHGLTNGHTYYVQISALNGATNQNNGEGPTATSARVTPTGVPDRPTITSLTPADSLVTLIWIPPTNNGGLPVLTFTIYVSIGLMSVYPPISVTAVAGQSSYTQVIDGLTNGTLYDIAVTASNGNGESQPASRQATPVGVPSAPTITHIESNWVRIKLDWIPPINNGGSPPLTNYYIYLYYADTNALAKVVDTNSGTQLTTLLTDLSFGTCYYAKVSAWNNRGEGPQSAPSEVVCVGYVPDAPVILSAVGEYASVFTRWSVPKYDGGFPILYYNVYAYYENTLLLASGAQSTILTFLSFLGLTNGIQYLMRVSAVNAVGEGPQSDPYGPVTPLPTLCGQTTVYGTDYDIYDGSGTVWPQQPYPSTNGPRLTGANLTEEQQAWNFFELVEAYDASVRVRMSGANYVPPPAVGSGASSPWFPILNQDQQLLYRNGQVIHEVMFPCYCWRSQRYLGISKDHVTNVYPRPSL